MVILLQPTEATDASVNIEELCQTAEQWKRENREAIEWSNDYVRKHGLPLEKYRMF
jgi:antitoxin CcdA